MRVSVNESSLRQRGFAISISASSVVKREIGVESDAGCGERVFMKTVHNRMRISGNEFSLQRGFAVSISAASSVVEREIGFESDAGRGEQVFN